MMKKIKKKGIWFVLFLILISLVLTWFFAVTEEADDLAPEPVSRASGCLCGQEFVG